MAASCRPAGARRRRGRAQTSALPLLVAGLCAAGCCGPWEAFSCPRPLARRTAATAAATSAADLGSFQGAVALDADFAPGYQAAGDDWSYAKSSARPDRPLSSTQLRSLTAKSDLKGLRQLAAQYAEILAGALLVARSGALGGPLGILLQILGTTLMGFGLVTMGHCAQHECIHNTAFKSRRANMVVSWLASLPRFTNPVWERMLHRDHHTYTNDPSRDPEILAGSPANALPGDFFSYVTRVLRLGGGRWGLGVWSTRAAILWNCARGKIVGYSGSDPVPDEKAKFVRNELVRSCKIQLAFYAGVFATISITGTWLAALKYWFVPLLVGEPCHSFFHIADHLNCEHDYRNGRGNTRTTSAPAFVRFNLWNMNYHAEHHLYPSIPFHQLPAANKLLQGHFERTSPSALSMHRQLLSRWMPHFQSRLEQGREAVEAGWMPYSPDH